MSRVITQDETSLRKKDVLRKKAKGSFIDILTVSFQISYPGNLEPQTAWVNITKGIAQLDPNSSCVLSATEFYCNGFRHNLENFYLPEVEPENLGKYTFSALLGSHMYVYCLPEDLEAAKAAMRVVIKKELGQLCQELNAQSNYYQQLWDAMFAKDKEGEDE